MCGVCVSVQSASLAPAAYVAGFAAVGTAGWHRLRRHTGMDSELIEDPESEAEPAES